MSLISSVALLTALSLQPPVDESASPAESEAGAETLDVDEEARATGDAVDTTARETSTEEVVSSPSPPPPSAARIELQPRALRERTEWYQARDEKLKRNTIAFGVATACLAGFAGLMMVVQQDADSNVPATFGGVFGASATVTGIATVISAVVLGNHRNGRAQVIW